jgi:hypothetical protein
MKKILFIVSFLFVGLFVKAQTGIGTTTPAAKLHVKSNGQIFRLEGSDHAYMELYPQGASTRYGYIGYPNANSTNLSFMNQFATGLLAFGTNNTNRMWLNADGKLGIGTSSPGTSLHIQNGNTFGNPGSTASPSIYVLNSNNSSAIANATMTLQTAGTGGGKPYYSLDVAGAFGYSMGINNPTDQFIINASWDFNSTAGNNAIIINRSGQTRVAIPAANGSLADSWPSGWGGGLATYDFACAGIFYQTLTARSDRRLKNTVLDLDSSSIEKYLQLRPVNYFWNDGSDNHHKQYGLIAQEVEPLFPDIVSTATDSMQTKSINYQALHSLSLKVIQTQQIEIELLKKKQSDFEARLLKLESKLN